MSSFGSPAPISSVAAIAGAAQSERTILREADKKRPARPAATRAADGFEADISDVETVDAVRDLKGNDQEEAQQDHREHPGYSAAPTSNDPDRPPAIDVQA